MPSPLVSVVIPSYFHEAYIDLAVSSVLRQSWSNIELVVVDDGSKDRSLVRLRRNRDPRFRLIEQSNRGAHHAINSGLEVARGDYLAILNSDDIFHPDRMAVMMRMMAEQNAHFACSWIQQIDHVGTPGAVKRGWTNELPSWAHELANFSVKPDNRFLYELWRTNFISTTSNMVFSRRVYEKIGGMRNLRFAHDWDFAFRAATEFKSIVVPQVLMQYRTHATNTIRSNQEWMLFEVLWILAVHRDKVRACLAEMPEEEFEASHYGTRQDVFSDILQKINGDLGEGESRGIRLLDDAMERAPFVARVIANASR